MVIPPTTAEICREFKGASDSDTNSDGESVTDNEDEVVMAARTVPSVPSGEYHHDVAAGATTTDMTFEVIEWQPTPFSPPPNEDEMGEPEVGDVVRVVFTYTGPYRSGRPARRVVYGVLDDKGRTITAIPCTRNGVADSAGHAEWRVMSIDFETRRNDPNWAMSVHRSVRHNYFSRYTAMERFTRARTALRRAVPRWWTRESDGATVDVAVATISSNLADCIAYGDADIAAALQPDEPVRSRRSAVAPVVMGAAVGGLVLGSLPAAAVGGAVLWACTKVTDLVGPINFMG
jgi:hypothetical protein